MANLIAELLLLFEELKFWKRKKERREKEEKEKLPKKTMIHPVVWITLVGISLIYLFKIFVISLYPNPQKNNTINSFKEIKVILEKQKKDLGKYPVELKDIIGINPMRKGINIDAWGNEFYYQQLDNGLRYELKSKGKDGILNTKDDITDSDIKK